MNWRSDCRRLANGRRVVALGTVAGRREHPIREEDRGKRPTRSVGRGCPYIKRAAGEIPPTASSRCLLPRPKKGSRRARERALRRAVSPVVSMIACCGRGGTVSGCPPRSWSLASASSSIWTPQRVHKRARRGGGSTALSRFLPLRLPPAIAHHHGIGAPAAAGRAAELEILQRLVAQHR